MLAPQAAAVPRLPAALSARDALLAASLVTAGSCIRGQLLLTVGLPLVLAGLWVASRAMWQAPLSRRAESTGSQAHAGSQPTGWAVAAGLLLLALIGVCAPSTPGGSTYDIVKRLYFVVAAGGVVTWSRAGGSRPGASGAWSSKTLTGLMVAATTIHLAGPFVVPDPIIDNWAWTQSCLRALANGIHPYSVQTADIIHGAYYEGRSAVIYPYMPLTIVAGFPSYILFGDYRYVGALAVPVIQWGLGRLGTLLDVDATHVDLARWLVLLHPRGFSLTCLGWLEPTLAMVLVLFACLAVSRPGGLGQAAAFLVVPSLKQYFLAPAIMFVIARRLTAPKTIVAALLLVGAGAAPFFIWDWDATLTGVLSEMTTATTPRLDSTSLVTVMTRLTGHYPGRWLSVVVQCGVGAGAYWRLHRHGLAGLLLASALAMLATFLTAWQAFVNYFALVAMLLVLASMCFAARKPVSLTPA